MPQQPPALARHIPRQRHAAEMAAEDVRNSIVLCQPLVDEGVVRAEQFRDAAILAKDVLEKIFRLGAKRLPQVVVEIWKQPQVGTDPLELPQVQPLRTEVRDQISRAFVRPRKASSTLTI